MGTFKLLGLPPVRKNVNMYKGDADLNSSTKAVFHMLGREVGGGQGRRMEGTEFRAQRNAEVEFLGYVNRGQPAALRIIKISPSRK